MTVEETSNFASGTGAAPAYTQVPQAPYASAPPPAYGGQQYQYPAGGQGVVYSQVPQQQGGVVVIHAQPAVSNDVVGPIVVLVVGLCCPILWLLGLIWWNATDATARILGRVSVALCLVSCCVSMILVAVYVIIVLVLVCC